MKRLSMHLGVALAVGLLLAGAGAAAEAEKWPGNASTPEAKLWRALEKAGAESVSATAFAGPFRVWLQSTARHCF